MDCKPHTKQIPTMKPEGGARALNSEKNEAPAEKPAMPAIDFSKVVIEPLFEDFVTFETFASADYRAVKVKECEAVKGSKKLLKFLLDDGTGTDRVILSGVHAYYEPEQLVGKTLLAITNLPPRPMMGIDSCGMLLSCLYKVEDEDRLNIIILDDVIPAGAKMY